MSTTENSQFKPLSNKPHNIYFTDSLAESDTLAEALDAKLAQLNSMTMVIRGGEGGDSFRRWNDEIQDNYHGAVSEMVEEIQDLFMAYRQLK